MIDLHCHLLPELDDGSKTMEDALEMAKDAVAQGITTLVCTPHLNEQYKTTREAILYQVATLQDELLKQNLPLRLYEGQEIRISPTLVEEIQNEMVYSCDLNQRYYLIELPTRQAPLYTLEVLENLIILGKVPIIAHPERHHAFIKDPNAFLPYLELGCLGQLTAPSLLGKFGKAVQKTAKQMVKHNFVQTMASDAHGRGKRPFYLKEAFDVLEKKYGTKKRKTIEQTTQAIFEGKPLRPFSYQKVSRLERIFK